MLPDVVLAGHAGLRPCHPPPDAPPATASSTRQFRGELGAQEITEPHTDSEATLEAAPWCSGRGEGGPMCPRVGGVQLGDRGEAASSGGSSDHPQ